MRTSIHAAAAALVAFALAGSASASAETIGSLPIHYGKIKVMDYEGNDFTILDKTTRLEWKFPSGDQRFYELLGRLDGVAPGNLAQLAYVGNPVGGELGTDHAAWVAPMTADNQPSAYPGRITSRDAKPFDPQALKIEPTVRGLVLSDGQVTVAEVRQSDDDSSLQLLKQMLQTNGLNTAWQIPSGYERTMTPVGSNGPVVVFLKAGATAQPVLRQPKGTSGAVRVPSPARAMAAPPPAEPQEVSTPEVSTPQATTNAEAQTCHWWSPRCWSLKAKAAETNGAMKPRQ